MDRYLQHIRHIIIQAVNDQPFGVILFGSRVSGKARAGSDVDVALYGAGAVDKRLLVELSDRLDNSTIPYKVQLVDLSGVSDNFRTQVFKEGVVWKDID